MSWKYLRVGSIQNSSIYAGKKAFLTKYSKECARKSRLLLKHSKIFQNTVNVLDSASLPKSDHF